MVTPACVHWFQFACSRPLARAAFKQQESNGHKTGAFGVLVRGALCLVHAMCETQNNVIWIAVMSLVSGGCNIRGVGVWLGTTTGAGE